MMPAMGSILSLATGDAFDVKVRAVVDKRTRLGAFDWQSEMRYELSNALPRPVTVKLLQEGLEKFKNKGYEFSMALGEAYYKDALYNAAGAVLRQDRTGRAGDDIGSELDLLVNFHLTDRQDVFMSYSHLFTGSFIKATGPGMPLDYLYLQYSMRW